MEKLKTICRWIAVDGLLHILVCYSCMLTFMPIFLGLDLSAFIATILSAFIAIILSVGKEVIDAIRGKNTKKQRQHDFICDGIGVVVAIVTISLWAIIYL